MLRLKHLNLRENWARYYQDPFGFMDGLELTFRGVNFNIFQKTSRLRKTAFGGALVSLAMWIVCGFDSTPLQFVHAALYALPRLVDWVVGVRILTLGQILQGTTAVYNDIYGKEMHYSAFVLYFFMFGLLSWYYERTLRISKSRNVAFSAALTFLAIGTFEFFWIYSFSYWQRQPWVSTWAMPQLRILLQNVFFVSCGALGLLYLWVDSFIMEGKEIVDRRYSLNLSKITLGLLGLTVALALLWWFYPWPVRQITVALKDGSTWTSSLNFPQTLYTVKLDPGQGMNAGDWFYVQNDAVHALNTGLKLIWTLAILNLGLVRKHGL